MQIPEMRDSQQIHEFFMAGQKVSKDPEKLARILEDNLGVKGSPRATMKEVKSTKLSKHEAEFIKAAKQLSDNVDGLIKVLKEYTIEKREMPESARLYPAAKEVATTLKELLKTVPSSKEKSIREDIEGIRALGKPSYKETHGKPQELEKSRYEEREFETRMERPAGRHEQLLEVMKSLSDVEETRLEEQVISGPVREYERKEKPISAEFKLQIEEERREVKSRPVEEKPIRGRMAEIEMGEEEPIEKEFGQVKIKEEIRTGIKQRPVQKEVKTGTEAKVKEKRETYANPKLHLEHLALQVESRISQLGRQNFQVPEKKVLEGILKQINDTIAKCDDKNTTEHWKNVKLKGFLAKFNAVDNKSHQSILQHYQELKERLQAEKTKEPEREEVQLPIRNTGSFSLNSALAYGALATAVAGATYLTYAFVSDPCTTSEFQNAYMSSSLVNYPQEAFDSYRLAFGTAVQSFFNGQCYHPIVPS